MVHSFTDEKFRGLFLGQELFEALRQGQLLLLQVRSP